MKPDEPITCARSGEARETRGDAEQALEHRELSAMLQLVLLGPEDHLEAARRAAAGEVHPLREEVVGQALDPPRCAVALRAQQRDDLLLPRIALLGVAC